MYSLSIIILTLNTMFAVTTKLEENSNYNHLMEYSRYKKIPKIIEESALIALSYYPELKDTRIDFVFKKNIKQSVMQAQPKFDVLLNGKGNRAYQINISSLFKLNHAAIPIHQLPKNIMIGWIGHELGHIMDYESRGLIGMLRFGFGYIFSDKYIKKAEQKADTYAVNHGLGFYIIETKRFILDHTDLPEVYKEKISRLYLSPDEIVEQVRKLEEQRAAKIEE
ncbi:hypothetical protein [Pedobacter alpinus]|uniref:Uncharacterized protein n=1 Tax=Pedobacter alpinus TaxID=1590643 RepID=A0ABW5TQX4_9SPHI